MAEQQADQQASNAIVAGVAFYAAALARAHGEIVCRDKTIAELTAESEADAKKTDEIRVSREKFKQEAYEAKVDNNELKLARDGADKSLGLERAKSNQLELEKQNALRKFDEQRGENERLQRALVESHHERDELRKKVHESGEAMGWLKNDANRFVSELRSMAATTGRTVATANELLSVIGDAIDEYRANHPVENVAAKPRRLPTKA